MLKVIRKTLTGTSEAFEMGYVDYQVTDHDTVDIVVHTVVTE